jgi:hypothetical protein
MDNIGASRPNEHGDVVWPSDRATCALLGLVAHLMTSCAPEGSRDKLLTSKKISGQFKFGKVSETSKYTKQVFLFNRVITKIRGIDGKSP